jgi:hypothetical protein
MSIVLTVDVGTSTEVVAGYADDDWIIKTFGTTTRSHYRPHSGSTAPPSVMTLCPTIRAVMYT